MFFVPTPGLKVVVPATAADAKLLLKAAIADPDPVIFIEHKALYRAPALREVLPGPDAGLWLYGGGLEGRIRLSIHPTFDSIDSVAFPAVLMEKKLG